MVTAVKNYEKIEKTNWHPVCVCPSPADRRAIAIERCIVCLGELCRGSSLPMKIDHYVNVGNLQTGFAQQRRRLQSVSPTRYTVRSLW